MATLWPVRGNKWQIRTKTQAKCHLQLQWVNGYKDRRSGKVVISRRTKHSYSESKGTRDHMTVNACTSASGVILLSHIIFSQTYPFGPYARDGPDGALHSISENRYMDNELLYAFINRLFILQTTNPNSKTACVCLMVMGHTWQWMLFCENLCLYCLTPHTTHVFQPVDILIFHPVKKDFNKLTHNLTFVTLGRTEPINCSKTNFTKTFKQSWDSINVALVKKGF